MHIVNSVYIWETVFSETSTEIRKQLSSPVNYFYMCYRCCTHAKIENSNFILKGGSHLGLNVLLQQ